MPTMIQTLELLFKGLMVTLQITAAGAVLAAMAALTAGLARLSHRRAIRWIAAVYVEIFRGTSALVQLFWAYFVLPFFGIDLGAMAAAILVLGLNTGAYGAEVVRGAIQAVPPGQRDAAAALNMSPLQAMYRVILPQALPAMVPPAGNLVIELLKNTALVSLIAVTDLTFTAQLARTATLESGRIFTLVLLIYFAVAICITKGFRLLESRLGRDIAR